MLFYSEPEFVASPGGAKRFLSLAFRLGLCGDLWRSYLTYLLLSDENPFSLSCETNGTPDKNMAYLAAGDVKTMIRLFGAVPESLTSELGPNGVSAIREFHAARHCAIGEVVRDMAGKLADAPDAETATALLADFYGSRGVGRFSFYHAFRAGFESGRVTLRPIEETEQVSLVDLVGYEIQKRELIANTEAFIAGRPANNVLLYGDGGTGKSTSIRALINDYRDTRLRMVEVCRQHFVALPDIFEALGRRNYRFIIFIDDLSFEEHETEYKALKAAVEGGLAARPENVLIYATSNRRHIIRETWGDRDDMEHNGDIHRSDTVEEKLSLASRFGLALNYSAPNRKEYHEMVKTLAERAGLDGDSLTAGANAWEIRHGGLSGRTARQYVNYILSGEVK